MYLFPMLFHPSMLILLPALILAMYAQMKVKSTYRKFSGIQSTRRISGGKVAEALLGENGCTDVKIEVTPGNLSDHYDPRKKVLRLSEGVFRSTSIAAIGVAAHEVGHAVQHRMNYFPLNIRHAIFPVANIGSSLAMPLFLIGFLFQAQQLMTIGILFFTGAVLFQIVTLPVEFNASSRALKQLDSRNYLVGDEVRGARAVLNAAALTYVAATAVALAQLLRLILLRGSRD